MSEYKLKQGNLYLDIAHNYMEMLMGTLMLEMLAEWLHLNWR